VVTVLLWLAAYLPGLLDQLDVDPVSVPSLALFLAVLGVVARLSQTGVIDRVLDVVDLGTNDGRHEA
jgi:hypothetical protein